MYQTQREAGEIGMKTGAECLADELYAQGVRAVFVFTGGAIAAIIDAAHRRGIKVIPYDHELDAAYAAEGYVRASAMPTAVMVTSGPGATNTISGMAGSWFDSIPVLFISGQVKSVEKTNFELYLQRGFQEVDFLSVSRQFSKYSQTVDHASTIVPSIKQAFQAMVSGRPGPAVLDVTMDAQMEMIVSPEVSSETARSFAENLQAGRLANTDPGSSDGDFRYLLDRMNESPNPVILVGGGAQWLPQGLLESVVKKLNIKVITTYAGVNALRYSNPLYEGMIGPFGHPEANETLLAAADLFILGARIPHRAMPLFTEESGTRLQSVRKWALTIEPREFISHRIGPLEKIFFGLLYDFCMFVESNMQQADVVVQPSNTPQCYLPSGMFARQLQQSARSPKHENSYTVDCLITSLNKSLPASSDIFVDVGQNAVALALGLQRDRGQRLFSSWANSPMGYSLPAALGAAAAGNERPTICVIGDGGMRTALSSLPNLRAMTGKVKVVLWDNRGYQTIVDHSIKFGQTGNPVNMETGLAYFPLTKVLDASGVRVMEAKGELESTMHAFFGGDDHDVLIVSIDDSIRMSANAPI